MSLLSLLILQCFTEVLCFQLLTAQLDLCSQQSAVFVKVCHSSSDSELHIPGWSLNILMTHIHIQDHSGHFISVSLTILGQNYLKHLHMSTFLSCFFSLHTMHGMASISTILLRFSVTSRSEGHDG